MAFLRGRSRLLRVLLLDVRRRRSVVLLLSQTFAVVVFSMDSAERYEILFQEEQSRPNRILFQVPNSFVDDVKVCAYWTDFHSISTPNSVQSTPSSTTVVNSLHQNF